MQRLAIRLARRLNALAGGRRGGVFADRYHARALRTPREVSNAILATGVDAPLTAPTVWLLRVGWKMVRPPH